MNQNIQYLTRDLAALLSQNANSICTAESCTGGLIVTTFTDLAGSSAWFDRGFITYSNQAKIDMLGVKTSTLEEYGAVSKEIAAEMVLGALEFSQSQVAVSVTGIAGPGGGSELKPVGTVCFGFALKNKNQVWTEKKWFEGSRSDVRQASLLFALKYILHILSSQS